MSNNDWYSTENWYAPMAHTANQPKKKKKGRGWLIAAAIVGVIAMIAGSTVLVNKFLKNSIKLVSDSVTIESGDNIDPSMDENGMPKDWKAYLDSVYSGKITAKEESKIEKIGGDPDFSIQIYSNANAELLDLQEIYDRCLPSIVAIKAYKESSTGYGWATGVIISENGYIVTNAHVVSGYSSATVCLSDNTEYEAKLVGSDSISDIALIKIDAHDLPTVQLGDSSELNEGDSVAAIGNPLGETFRFTMTNGIVSAIDRDISSNGHTMTLIQTNAAINEGNSGGPLINMYGQVVGIVNMKMMSSYQSIEGIGFAIPSNTVCTVVNDMVVNGEVTGRVSLGITVGVIPDMFTEYYGLPKGLYVSSVVEGTDAAQKGITKGDILTKVDGVQIEESSDVLEQINKHKQGESVLLTVWRDGEVVDFEVALMNTNEVY